MSAQTDKHLPTKNGEALPTPITVAFGDGIGPELIEACLHILREAGADISIETIEIGKRIYNMDAATGILPSSWDSLRRTKVLLKAPVTKPQDKEVKSLDITLRKMLGLYANIRPTRSYHPIIACNHPNLDMVIIRENEEDVYAGIEYRQTHDSAHCNRILSHSGSERILRYGFDYAQKNKRRKISCVTKEELMKLTDGTFHQLFIDIGKSYPDIEQEHLTMNAAAARIASHPETFDVIITGNLYGDILADIAAKLSGSVNLASAANIGEDFAMFEAIHNSAPDIDENQANPSGILHAAIMMLVHIGQEEAATKMHNALLKTLEDGIHTIDIYREGKSTEKVGTQEFAQAVIDRLGQRPKHFTTIAYNHTTPAPNAEEIQPLTEIKRELIGVDIYFHIPTISVKECAKFIKSLERDDGLKLRLLSNKGIKIWPNVDISNIHLSDQHRARFYVEQGKTTTNTAIASLLARAAEHKLEFIHTENLYLFNGHPGFSLAQGE